MVLFLNLVNRNAVPSTSIGIVCQIIFSPRNFKPEKLTDHLLRLLLRLGRSGQTHDVLPRYMSRSKNVYNNIQSRKLSLKRHIRHTPITGADLNTVLQSLEPVNADVNSYRNIDESNRGDVEMVAKASGHHGSVQSIDSSMSSEVEDDGSMGSDVENNKSSLGKRTESGLVGL